MFHIHIYFRQTQIEEALLLKARIAKEFPALVLGRTHEKPVGPHPVGSFEIDVMTQCQFDALSFFLKNKIGHLSAMIHPVTGDDLEDHRDENISWIGTPYHINRQFFHDLKKRADNDNKVEKTDQDEDAGKRKRPKRAYRII